LVVFPPNNPVQEGLLKKIVKIKTPEASKSNNHSFICGCGATCMSTPEGLKRNQEIVNEPYNYIPGRDPAQSLIIDYSPSLKA
jgi:hypothetical protein